MRLTADMREARIARVRVDGCDVTHDCYAADDEAGYADCYVRDADGRVLCAHDDVARQRLTGGVVIDFPYGLD